MLRPSRRRSTDLRQFLWPGACSLCLHLLMAASLATGWRAQPEVVWVSDFLMAEPAQTDTPDTELAEGEPTASATSDAEEPSGTEEDGERRNDTNDRSAEADEQRNAANDRSEAATLDITEITPAEPSRNVAQKNKSVERPSPDHATAPATATVAQAAQPPPLAHYSSASLPVKLRQEKAAAEKAAALKAAAEKAAALQAAALKAAAEKAAAQQAAAERAAALKAAAEKAAAEQAAAERAAAQQAAAERAAALKAAAEKAAAEKAAALQAAAERAAAQQAAAEKAAALKAAAEKAAAQQAAAERAAAQQAAAEKAATLKAAAERAAAQQAAAEKAATLKAAAERAAAQQAAAERAAALKAAAEKAAALKAAAERAAAQQAAAEKAAALKAAAEKAAAQQAAAEKAAALKAAAEKAAALQAAAERAAALKAAAERAAAQQAAAERAAALKAAAERAAAQQAATERAAAQAALKAAAERAAAQQAAAERAAALKAAAEKAAAQQAAAERAATLKAAAQQAAAQQAAAQQAAAQQAAARKSDPVAPLPSSVAARPVILAAINGASPPGDVAKPVTISVPASGSSRASSLLVANQPPAHKLVASRPQPAAAPTRPAGEDSARKSPVPMPVFEAPLKGDLELEFIGKEIAANGIKIQIVFREYPRNRHKKAMTPAESKRTKILVPKSSRTGMNTVQTVVETAADGIYEFRGGPDNARAQEVICTLTIHGTSSKPTVKRLGTRKVGSDSYIVKLMMPEGVVWDDDGDFSGSIQGSDGVTKYNSDTGLVWKEFN